MADFTRKPSISRMRNGGMKLNCAPDAIPEGKFAYLENVRGYYADQITSRPQWAQLSAPAGGGPVLALEPALGLYKVGAAIFLSATSISVGYTPGTGCSLIPFRPNQSPQAWEYVFDSGKQVKVLPNSAAPVSSTIKKVGIAEPQLPCDAYYGTRYENIYNTFNVAASYTHSGTCSSVSDGQRINPSDTVVGVYNDPVYSTYPGVCSVQVGNTVQYQKGETVTIDGNEFRVLDVFPAATQSVGVAGVYYFASTIGHCVIVPTNINAGAGDPGIGISQQQLLGSLRRGAILNFYIGATLEGSCYVWSVTEGPDGSVCIETSTSFQVTTAMVIVAQGAIQISNGELPTIPQIGQSITSSYVAFTVTAGIGSVEINISAFKPIFIIPSSQGYAFQDDDYLHLSILIDNPNNLISCRIGLDVSDGTFTKDYYYYEIRPSDLQGALTGSSATQLTQLAAAQLLGQRSSIDSEQATAYNNEIFSNSGGQLLAGGGTPLWTEIVLPLSKFTRVGNDQTKTLANTGYFSFAVNASATVNMAINSFTVYGGGQPDSGASIPYQYRYRARDSQTGAASNWSPVMRYGFSPERTQAQVIIPAQDIDSQADTYDIERMGGALEQFTYIGSILIAQPSGSVSTVFIDNYGDDQVADNDELPEDNYEPFPSIGPPLVTLSNGATLTGYVAILQFPSASTNASFLQLSNLLPGNEIQVGQQVYTTYSRPTLLSTIGGVATWLILLQENAGVLAGMQTTISEPALANQTLGQVWGPDDNGCLHAVGDSLRPGGVYNTNPNNPDGCNEGVNFNELCAPTEPLLNGALIQQTSCVASTKRWWAGRSGQDAAGNLKYAYVEIPVGRGLAAIYGICTDGNNIYFVGPDGIYSHSGGPAISLTDEDLYPLFPHEGVLPGNQPQNIVTYSGQTVYAPDYSQAQAFRLAVANGFLYFDYLDSSGTYRTLTCNLLTRGWVVDTFAAVAGYQISIHAATIAPVNPAPGQTNSQVYAGLAGAHHGGGAIYIQNSSPVTGTGESVPVIVQTRDETGDDVRASKLFGDAMIDTLPLSALTITPLLFGIPQPTTVVPVSATRIPALPIDISGEAIAQTMALLITWSDQGVASILFAWQVSWVPQPENTARRFTDWDGGPGGRNLFFQGFELEADTLNAVKGLAVRDADTLTLHPFKGPTALTSQVQHNGQQVLPYSFVAPFQAHLVRLEPQDSVLWRMFRVRWITRPTPDSALNWITQPTSYGIAGYHHVHHAMYAYASTQPLVLNITTDTVVTTYSLPSTGGAYRKVRIMFAPVKGLVDIWSAVSAAAFQVWQEDIEIFVKGWGDTGAYVKARLLGAPMVPDADI
jgi:hypothetical protein